MFVLEDVIKLPEGLFELMGLKKENASKKLNNFEMEFKKYRLEKALTKSIKFKVGVINTNGDLNKWETLGNIAERFGSPLND